MQEGKKRKIQGERGNEMRQGFDNFSYYQHLLHKKRNGAFYGEKLEEMQGKKGDRGEGKFGNIVGAIMNIYYSKEEFKEMRKRERWKVWQCYICCLHILYKRKQKEEKKKQ